VLFLKGKSKGIVFCKVYMESDPSIYDLIIVTVGSVI